MNAHLYLLHIDHSRSSSSASGTTQDHQVLQADKHTIFYPIARETAGTWNDKAIELVQEIGRRTKVITEETSSSLEFSCFSGCQEIRRENGQTSSRILSCIFVGDVYSRQD